MAHNAAHLPDAGEDFQFTLLSEAIELANTVRKDVTMPLVREKAKRLGLDLDKLDKKVRNCCSNKMCKMIPFLHKSRMSELGLDEEGEFICW